MEKSKKVLIVLGAIVVIIIVLFASGILTFTASINRTGDTAKIEESQKNIETGDIAKTNYETAVFQSKYGFSMDYPKSWIVDISEKAGPFESIREPNGKAYIVIQTANDPRLKVFSSRAVTMLEAENALKKDKQYTINSFEWKYADAESDVNSYMATGSFNDKNGDKWLFKEIGVFIPDGTEFFFQSNALALVATEYGPMLDKIIFSYWPIKNQVELSRVKVQSLPEVKEYEKMLAESGKKATIEVEDGGDAWNVHIFEIVKEKDGSSHNATFGWYGVNKRTGVIEKSI